MTPTSLPHLLIDAIGQAQHAVDAQIDAAVATLPDDARLRDELERTIDEVSDPSLQNALRRILQQFDVNALRSRATLANLSIHSGFDPLRIVAKDIAAGNL